MKTLKEIHEGFFDNVGGICPKLNEFLKANKDNIVVLDGKEYIIKSCRIFDVTNLKNTVYRLMDRNTIRMNKDGKMYRDIFDITWQIDGSYIDIKYYFYSLTDINNGTKPNHYESMCFMPITEGRGYGVKKEDKDKILIDFLKSIAK